MARYNVRAYYRDDVAVVGQFDTADSFDDDLDAEMTARKIFRKDSESDSPKFDSVTVYDTEIGDHILELEA